MYLPVAWIVTVVAIDMQPTVDIDALAENSGLDHQSFGQYHRLEPVQALQFRLADIPETNFYVCGSADGKFLRSFDIPETNFHACGSAHAFLKESTICMSVGKAL